MMKSKDCAVATALIIQGFLRPVELEHSASESKKSMALFECLSAIRQECHDWAENLPAPAGAEALEPNAFSFDLMVGAVDAPRTPYNLVSAAISLVREAIDLNGPKSTMSDFTDRLHRAQATPEKTVGFKPAPTGADLIDALVAGADALVAEIDASEERPVAKQAVWDVAIAHLRSLGVNVEERCLAPSQW